MIKNSIINKQKSSKKYYFFSNVRLWILGCQNLSANHVPLERGLAVQTWTSNRKPDGNSYAGNHRGFIQFFQKSIILLESRTQNIMVIFLLPLRFLPTLFMLFVFEKLQRTEVNQKAIKKRVRTECESCAMRETIYTKNLN